MDSVTKLLINLKEGIVQVEGAEEFVRDVYNDFKERVSKPVVIPSTTPARLEQQPEDIEGSTAPIKTGGPRRSASGAGKTGGDASNYKPKFNNDLNLADLPQYYEKYAPSGHNEIILVFAAFMRDKMGKAPCTADDVYTCYFTMRAETKIPTAFVQAFRNCQTRTHYIKYTSLTEIEVAIPGDNFLAAKSKQ
jgi:hypothetical protein